MKKAWIIILVEEMLMTVATGFSFITTEKIVDICDYEVTADKNRSLDWPPL